MKYIFPTLSMSSCAAQHFQNTSELCSYHLQHQFCRNESSKVDSDQQFKVASITKKSHKRRRKLFSFTFAKRYGSILQFHELCCYFLLWSEFDSLESLLRLGLNQSVLEVKRISLRFEVFDKFLDHLQGNLNGISI